MDELVKLVSRKTGLSEEMSREAVEIVLSYLKEKLTDPIAGQIDSVLGGAGLAESAEDLVKGLGGILGKQ
jgi:VIT1/CCC1 family predicted Fe2+/Mn2+ transporter